MKRILTAFACIFLFAISSRAQNVGIGTDTPLEKLSVGSTSQFRIDANGNIVRINNIPYSFPATQGLVNQVWRNNGSGTFSWAAVGVLPKPVVRVFSIANGGMTNWLIDNVADYNGAPFNADPTLVLYRGLTYQFDINAPGHPFRIAVASGGAAYNVGVSANDVSDGTITWTIPMDAPNNLFYYCTVHAAMSGTFIIR